MTFIKIPKIVIHFLLAFIFLNSGYCFSEDKVTVIYPKLEVSSNGVFSEILKGIESELDGDVIKLELPQNFNSKDIASRITTEHVITLGKKAMTVGKQVNDSKLVVFGALPILDDNMLGISSMASPQSLFEPLNTLANKVQGITVIYSQSSTRLIKDALQAAKKYKLTLNAILVDSLPMAVKAYDEFFENKASKSSALWLPVDPITVNDNIIVPTLLEKAWAKEIVVISSTSSHVERGVLYATILDNISMGQELATLVQKIENKNISTIVKTLKTIKLAVNLRTAKHLGYQYPQSKIEQFAFTFPE
ncbi:ABC transporter substrate binding protein [Pseudocolwellia agarivorans]|uniref:ABC transporter substrate binding protein n=1 Tax=Pseudocolwellia agarivorans TaxID=1911682 RepID=UPI003F884060